MKIDEIKSKMGELAEAAYQAGVDATAEQYEAKIAEMWHEANVKLSEAVKAAKEEAYQQGCSDTLKNIGVVAQDEGEAEQDADGKQPSTAADIDPADDGALPEFDITNEAVAKFMADTAYDAEGFATSDGKSVVEKYVSGVIVEGDYAKNWIEHPAPVYIKGKAYWNLIPNQEYTIDGVTFRTRGTVRQIHFPGEQYVSNCRDIGGYKCEGGTVRYGRIIRSAHLPDGLTKTSSVTKTLLDIGVGCEIDLRGKSAYTNLGWSGLSKFVYGYADALTNVQNYKTVLTRILTEVEQGKCVLLHCSAGADRTGTVVAVILGVLGVPLKRIIKDWELTTFCHWCNSKEISQWAERIKDPAYKAIALKEFPKGELREFFVAMKKTYGAKGETFKQQCEAFLTKKVRMTAGQIERLRKAMVMCSEFSRTETN